MHTPRFSGQLINAGDFVLLLMPSRPIRTSCENVGTVFPLLPNQRFGSHAHNFSTRFACAQTNRASAQHHAERCTANPERPARNSARTPRGRTPLLASLWRGLLGLAGLASHIRPLFSPNPSFFVLGAKILPTASGRQDLNCRS